MQLIDSFGRKITYIRLSVTDRCDLRCVYCMAEQMTFLPRAELLSLEELAILGETFTDLGVTKLRITGGEPLIRRGVIQLLENLGRLPKLKDLCLTTNGTHLSNQAQAIKDAGVTGINISLDSLNPQRFRKLTRFGNLEQVLLGIRAARTAGFKRIKLNCVALKNYNADEAGSLVQFALDEGLDISFIEEMPLGHIDDHGRAAEFVSSTELRQIINKHMVLQPAKEKTATDAGPSRYWQVPGYDSRIGFISPHSDNFCGSCNRMRVTATGRLLLCLGQEHSTDLRRILRDHPEPQEKLREDIIKAVTFKPERHHFNLESEPQILRFMNTTGG